MTREPCNDRSFYLMPRATLKEFISFMTTSPLNAERYDRRRLADTWRAAHCAFEELQKREAGWPDQIRVEPLPAELQALGERVMADPLFLDAYGEVKMSVGMVELDRVIVSQRVLSSNHMNRLRQQLGETPSADQIFHFCLPIEHPMTDCTVARISDHEYAFTSPSNDLRFLGPAQLPLDRATGLRENGRIAGLIGLMVGYSANCLNLLDIQGRLVLRNGSHRAYTLRAQGITHAPCLIQKITCKDELEMIALEPVRLHPDFFLKAPRPTLLKDYFDPSLILDFDLPLTQRQVRLRFSVEVVNVP